MRYVLKSKSTPTEGSIRKRTKFLLLPKKIGKEIRWLEKATWEERYIKEYHCGGVDYDIDDKYHFIWEPLNWSSP